MKGRFARIEDKLDSIAAGVHYLIAGSLSQPVRHYRKDEDSNRPFLVVAHLAIMALSRI